MNHHPTKRSNYSDKSNGSHTGPKIPRAKCLVNEIQVTLEELYNGTWREYELHKRPVCDVCGGSGTNSAEALRFGSCEQCNGVGWQKYIINTNDGFKEVNKECDLCDANGWTNIPEDRCGQCSGRGSLLRHAIEPNYVQIRKGIRHDQKIIYQGARCRVPYKRPGNITFVLKMVDHLIFKRQGDDLCTTIRLELVEALCGFEKLITTLDKRRLVIRNPPGHVIQENEHKCILGEGMPKYIPRSEEGRSSRGNGNLIIKFEINFPTAVRNTPVIEQCLRGRQQVLIPTSAVVCNMIDWPIPQENEYMEQSEDDYQPYDMQDMQDDHNNGSHHY